ncbi:MAG: ferritin-like domain-containing protein [Planctomycetota bacterium]
MTRRKPRRWRPTPSAAWVEHFARNTPRWDRVPAARQDELSACDRLTIARSIAEFQVGESGQGRTLRRLAGLHARRRADPAYAQAMELFVVEEQRHASELLRFMQATRIEPVKQTSTNLVFRRLRKLAGLELIISVLLVAEIVALVYYRALSRATRSPTLRTVCGRILEDEGAHVRFHAERIAMLRARRPWLRRTLAGLAQRGLLMATAVIVWRTHGPVLRAGGYSFVRFVRDLGRCGAMVFGRADPRRYANLKPTA